VDLGANHVDFSNEEASINSSTMLETIIGQEYTELKQNVVSNGGILQWMLEQKGVPGFDSSSIPLDDVCFPLAKFLNLFDGFKCHHCESRHKKTIILERYGFAQSLYNECLCCGD
jgi:hypothetical protein